MKLFKNHLPVSLPDDKFSKKLISTKIIKLPSIKLYTSCQTCHNKSLPGIILKVRSGYSEEETIILSSVKHDVILNLSHEMFVYKAPEAAQHLLKPFHLRPQKPVSVSKPGTEGSFLKIKLLT